MCRRWELGATADTALASMAPSIACTERVAITAGVAAFALSSGAVKDVDTITKLCLDLVPGAIRVLVTVEYDCEDNSAGLLFRVWASASVEAVVAAEHHLHDALSERIPHTRRRLFSDRLRVGPLGNMDQLESAISNDPLEWRGGDADLCTRSGGRDGYRALSLHVALSAGLARHMWTVLCLSPKLIDARPGPPHRTPVRPDQPPTVTPSSVPCVSSFVRSTPLIAIRVPNG